VLFQRQQDAEERGFREIDTFADVLEGEWGLAVKAVEDVECATNGPQVVLLVGGRRVGWLQCPFGHTATNATSGFL